MENIEKKKSVEGNKKKIIALAIALVLLIGGTYAWLTLTLNGTKTVRLESGTLSLELVDEANAINVADALPMADEDGKESDPYVFTLNNNGNIKSMYTVYLDTDALEDGLTSIPQNRVRYSLTKVVKQVNGTRDSLVEEGEDDEEDTIVEASTITIGTYNESENVITSKSLDSGSLEANQYIDYELRLWISSEATNEEIKDTAFASKLRIEAEQEGIEEDEAYTE